MALAKIEMTVWSSMIWFMDHPAIQHACSKLWSMPNGTYIIQLMIVHI